MLHEMHWRKRFIRNYLTILYPVSTNVSLSNPRSTSLASWILLALVSSPELYRSGAFFVGFYSHTFSFYTDGYTEVSHQY